MSDNNERFFNMAEGNPSILETLANLRTGELPTKTTKKTGKKSPAFFFKNDNFLKKTELGVRGGLILM